MAPSGPPGTSLAGFGGSEPGFPAPHAPLPGPRLVLLLPVLLTSRQGNRPGRSNWQNNSDRVALPRARPSPAGASVPAAETNSHNTPNKSSELRPPESLSAAGSAPPEPARTVSDRSSLCRAALLCAPARTTSSARGARREGRCPAAPGSPPRYGPQSPHASARRPPHCASLCTRPHRSQLPPARPRLPGSGAANQNFFLLPELLSQLPGGRAPLPPGPEGGAPAGSAAGLGCASLASRPRGVRGDRPGTPPSGQRPPAARAAQVGRQWGPALLGVRRRPGPACRPPPHLAVTGRARPGRHRPPGLPGLSPPGRSGFGGEGWSSAGRSVGAGPDPLCTNSTKISLSREPAPALTMLWI